MRFSLPQLSAAAVRALRSPAARAFLRFLRAGASASARKRRFRIRPPVAVPWRAELDRRLELVCVVGRDVNLLRYGLASVLPAGFRSDGMSVPRLFWRFIGPKVEGRTAAPAIIHDWLYASHAVSRREADRWLREALAANGMGAARSRMVYWAVRLFGGAHW